MPPFERKRARCAAAAMKSAAMMLPRLILCASASLLRRARMPICRYAASDAQRQERRYRCARAQAPLPRRVEMLMRARRDASRHTLREPLLPPPRRAHAMLFAAAVLRRLSWLLCAMSAAPRCRAMFDLPRPFC